MMFCPSFALEKTLLDFTNKCSVKTFSVVIKVSLKIKSIFLLSRSDISYLNFKPSSSCKTAFKILCPL